MKIFNLLKTVITAFANEPYQHVIAKIWRRVKNSFNPSTIHYNESDATLSEELELDRSISFDTKISFITPVYNPDPDHLRETIDSVFNQTAANWELCIHDDGSSEEIIEILKSYKAKDARVKLSIGDQNFGIVHASNKAIQLAENQYIAFLDHDDCIHPDTVRLISTALEKDNRLKLIYTDEDSINVNGYVESSLEKVSFGPNTFRSVNYINHLTVIDKHLGDKLGWLREEFEGAQDYDLLFRITECLELEQIQHIPKKLYHWRMTDSSISKYAWAKTYVDESAKMAVNAHLSRIGTTLTCKSGRKSGTYQLVSEVQHEPFIVIDLQIDSHDDYVDTVNSLISNTSYRNYKIKKADNWSHIKEQLHGSTQKSHFLDKTIEELQINDYYICVITKALTFPQSNWLKKLTIHHQIDSNIISSPLVTFNQNKIFSEGLFSIDGKLTNIYENRNRDILLDYFSDITKDVNGIYNICYLCANIDINKAKSIVLNAQSEVKLAFKQTNDYGVIIVEE